MANISEFNINNIPYNIKDKVLRDAANCPINNIAQDLPSVWKQNGTGFYSISTNNILIDQPAAKGFLYNLVDDSKNQTTANIVQLFFDYSNNQLYTRSGSQNTTQSIDSWVDSWSKYADDKSPFGRRINGLDELNHIYTDTTNQIIRVSDSTNAPIFKIQETNSSLTGIITGEITVLRNVNNKNLANYFRLNMDENGYGTYEISHQKSFREAIGASDGVWPIELGGTGASTAAQAAINLGVLPLSGGTLSGHIKSDYSYICNSQINPTITPSNAIYSSSISYHDKNDNECSSLYTVQDNDIGGTIYLVNQTTRQINSVPYYNQLRIGIDTNGTSKISVSDVSAWQEELQIFPSTGGTLNGDINLPYENKIKFNNSDYAFIQSKYVGSASNPVVQFSGGGNLLIGGGEFTINALKLNLDSCSSSAENLYLGADTNVNLYTKASVMGTESGTTNGIYAWKFTNGGKTQLPSPLEVEYGGTGVNSISNLKTALSIADSGWKTASMSTSNATGTIYYRKIGSIVTMYGVEITLAKTLGSSSLIAATYDTNYKGKGNIFVSAMANNGNNNLVKVAITTSGNVAFYRNGTDIASGTKLSFAATYMVA